MVDERQRSAAAAVSATCKIKAINLSENLFLFLPFFLVLLIVKEFVPMTLVQIRQKKNNQNATKNCLTVAQFSILFNSVKRLTYDELIFVKNREHFDDANLCHVTHVAKMSSVIPAI